MEIQPEDPPFTVWEMEVKTASVSGIFNEKFLQYIKTSSRKMLG